MNDIILITAIGIIAILNILAVKLIVKDIVRMHTDVRKIREYAFWSQRREREARKILRRKK